MSVVQKVRVIVKKFGALSSDKEDLWIINVPDHTIDGWINRKQL